MRYGLADIVWKGLCHPKLYVSAFDFVSRVLCESKPLGTKPKAEN